MSYFLKRICPVLFLFATSLVATGQTQVPTKGKEFWVGFMQNFIDGMPGESLELFVTSDVSTTGTISIPGQGWTVDFAVDAHTTTPIPLPVELAECRTHGSVESRGVYVTSADTISVFAINFEPYTADGTKVLPVQSLGTSYRVSSYAASGLSGSELVVVATEDGTRVSITPTAPTLSGQDAGVPFEVDLDAGQTYLVQSEFPGDLTGTLVEAAAASGSCRPFAVFSGATCAAVPETCAACDHIYEQNFPLSTWGTSYLAAPFLGPNTFTLRVIASENSTMVSVNGIPHMVNAGEVYELNELTTAQCIEATAPVQAVQFMEGVECGGVGDPAMLVLNSTDQQISAITFATVNSEVIDSHGLTVFTESTNIGSINLDGALLDPALFEVFPNCPSRSFARIPLSEGSHSLEADGPFTAYVYGNGFAESYAYSAGSFTSISEEEVPVMCFSDQLALEVSPDLVDVSWYLLPDEATGVGSGNQLLLDAPFASGIYRALGQEAISGCADSSEFEVEFSEPPLVTFLPEDPSICIFDTLQTVITIAGNTSGVTYGWEAEYGLIDTESISPDFFPETSTVYTLHLTSPGGCLDQSLNYVIEVIEEDPTFTLGPDVALCDGDSLVLDPALPADWAYTWSSGSGEPTYLAQIQEDISLNVSSPGGCVHSDAISIAISDAPDPVWEDLPVFCLGDSVAYSLTEPTWSVLWSDGHAGERWVSDATWVGYTVSDPLGCEFQSEIQAEVLALPDLYVPDETYVCEGESAQVEGLATDVAWLWQNGATESLTHVADAGFFSVTVTNSDGCSSQDSIWVEVWPHPEVDLGSDMILCEGETAILSVEGNPDFILWSTGSGATAIQVSETGVYSVEVSNGFCAATDQVQVALVPVPERPIPRDIVWCFDDSPLHMDPVMEAGNGYEWSNGTPSATADLYEAGLHTLTITTPLGCEIDYTMDAIHFCEDNALYLPNAFTPDGDGTNDTFGAVGSGIGRFHMQIWNRWGDLVFSTDDINASWDGSGDRRGKGVESEVYVFHITYTVITSMDGQEIFAQEKRGFVTVVR